MSAKGLLAGSVLIIGAAILQILMAGVIGNRESVVVQIVVIAAATALIWSRGIDKPTHVTALKTLIVGSSITGLCFMAALSGW